jgi:hypothetical protein
MNGITKEMINEFNELMESKGSIIRLYTRGSTVDISVLKDDYLKMEDQIINPSREFYTYLQSFFKKYGVKLHFNNTWSCFWTDGLVNELV